MVPSKKGKYSCALFGRDPDGSGFQRIKTLEYILDQVIFGTSEKIRELMEERKVTAEDIAREVSVPFQIIAV